MKLSDVLVRDPFMLKVGDVYYLYGTKTRGIQLGFDVYKSRDLVEFEGPIPVLPPENVTWSKRKNWAPEVYPIGGRYYMFATFEHLDGTRGTWALVSDKPDGTFVPHSDGPLTPKDWLSLDGTLAFEDGKPYMIFCHEWLQVGNGEILIMELSPDLTHAVGEPKLLWKAGDASWVVPVNGDPRNMVTDGPFIYHRNGELICLWSSFGADRDGGNSYAISYAVSPSGSLFGPWEQSNKFISTVDAGHGMIFQDLDGKDRLIVHTPNDHETAHPIFEDVTF